MMQFRSVTVTTPLQPGLATEETISTPNASLLEVSYWAVHLAPSYGSTRIDFEMRDDSTNNSWVRMSGQQVVNQVLKEVK